MIMMPFWGEMRLSKLVVARAKIIKGVLSTEVERVRQRAD